MGMFDTVRMFCPVCNEMVEDQSKAGECHLNTYTLQEAPISILGDIENKDYICPNNHTFTVKISSIAQVYRT
jgi:hypothetical protein